MLPGDEQVGCAPVAQLRDRPCPCSVDRSLAAILERIAQAQERSAVALERLAGSLQMLPGEESDCELQVGATGPKRESLTQPRPSEGLPLAPVSLARAAKLLGVSKSRTLRPALEAGAVRTVGHGKRRLVPPDELRRLATEGIRAPKKAPRKQSATRKSAPPTDLAAELARVAAIKV